eukprot:SAG31_NODE_4898_length_2878_cov_2.329975_4_plen_188_part_00
MSDAEGLANGAPPRPQDIPEPEAALAAEGVAAPDTLRVAGGIQVWSVEEIGDEPKKVVDEDEDEGSRNSSRRSSFDHNATSADSMSECGLSELGSEPFSEFSFDSSDNASDSGGYASDGSSTGYGSDASSGYASSDGEGGGRVPSRSSRRRSICRAHPLHHAAASGDILGVQVRSVTFSIFLWDFSC